MIASLWGSSLAIQLKTTSPRLAAFGSGSLQDFVSRPIHWPEIVLSSNRVEVVKARQRQQSGPKGGPLSSVRALFGSSDSNGNNPKAPVARQPHASASDALGSLEVGDTVLEYFALNQFVVEWTCTESEPGRLVVVSKDGVGGIATDCAMEFGFDDNGPNGGSVALTMEYTPKSPLAVLATPALVVDNWLALNVLLPAAVDATPLESFRALMGVLYGFAGAAHFLDLVAGGSQLFTGVIGIPSFWDLELPGRLCALLWCAAGPVAYALSRIPEPDSEAGSGPSPADAGLVAYGAVEVLGAVLASGIDGAAAGTVANSVGVQAVVLAAWVYSRQKQNRRQEQAQQQPPQQ